MSPILDSIGSVKAYGWGSIVSGPPSFESIATTTVGSGGSSSVTFSSIPNTYAHLQIRMFGQTNRTGATQDSVLVQFNNDASDSNYTRHVMAGDGSSISGGNATSGGSSASAAFGIRFGTNDGGTSRWGSGISDILDYANTNKYKTHRALGGTENGTTGLLGISSNLWLNTSAISTVVIKPHTGTQFNQYTHFALYGIKAAS